MVSLKRRTIHQHYYKKSVPKKTQSPAQKKILGRGTNENQAIYFMLFGTLNLEVSKLKYCPWTINVSLRIRFLFFSTPKKSPFLLFFYLSQNKVS